MNLFHTWTGTFQPAASALGLGASEYGCETFKSGVSTDTENTLVVAKGEGAGEGWSGSLR